ncbi:hypothetical protein OIE62_37395 [Streptomyces scopuliridis]|uniref:Uncharacterized protein n=1 Tax=Streptomyces scopuliridis TaxID=452529 RepID=A0ACD4ZEB9_9ACTN|nr:hypothetical protein [Streptomyces scopuliridis]WSB96156.1 hypothetical protein OG835_03530 [Streptomyces scopuliridis]WSC10138.1 hypothetical protein OIE62_37395 [Streptomyces scopuliridis]
MERTDNRFLPVLLIGAQAAVLWLRRAPRTALSVLLVLAGLWPAAMSVSGYAGPVLLPPGLSAVIVTVLARGVTTPAWAVIGAATAAAALAAAAA